MIIRAKRKELFQGIPLTKKQQENTNRNLKEIESHAEILQSYPRRLVFELTNACNLNCVMCGRNAADFKMTAFDMDVFRSFEPMMDIVEEVTLMGWGEPTIHPHFNEMLEIIDRHSARKYFCSNGMNLKNIRQSIFKYHVDVFAVSVDGATYETNARIRRGSDLNVIQEDLASIVEERNRHGLKYPWINFVFCAMESNIRELPDLVRLAAEIGIDEVKVVYLTVFNEELCDFSLSDISYYQQTFSVSAFHRAYVGLDPHGRFGIFNETDLSFGSGSSRFKRLYDGQPKDTRTNITQGALNFSPGVCIFVQDYVSFNISFGVFGLKWQHEKQTTDGIYEGSRTTSGANFRFNIFNINFGMMVVI